MLNNKNKHIAIKYNRGFTAIELMVTVALLAIFATFAFPNFTNLILRNTIDSEANDLIVMLNLARSEAIKRNRSVSLIARGGDWNTGYIVQIQATAIPIKDFVPRDNGGAIVSVPIITDITFSSAGLPIGLAAEQQFTVCKQAGEEGRSISISRTGRVRSADIESCPS